MSESETFSINFFNEFLFSAVRSRRIENRRGEEKRSFIKLIPIGAASKSFLGSRETEQGTSGIFLLKHLKLVLSHTFEGLYHLERLQPYRNRPKK